MQQSFDYFNQPDLPYILLSNPNKEYLFSLGLTYDTKITKRFNAISEFTFTFPKSVDGGETNIEAYEYIANKRLLEIEGYGWFQIIDPGEDLDGAVPIKKVKCQSLEGELISKRVTAYGGTKPLWNALDSSDTILQDMIDLAPNWSVNHVDTELLTLYRTFSVSDTNVYNFLMNDVSKAFECVFDFDTDNREINVYTLENATTETDIFLSFDNIISEATLDEKSDEITTCLSVYGGGTLNIRNVNPLGTDRIYDFSYYKSTDWMSQGLVNALTAWETVVDTQQPIYADNLTLLQTYNSEMLDLESSLAVLQSEYLAIEGIQVVRIQAGESYSDVTAALAAKQAEIDAQENLIENKQSQIDDVTLELQLINSLVSFDNNFTSEQLLELNNFIYENTYKNENIIQTDSMTLVEVQEAAQALYDQAVIVLERISQPRYEFSLESVNYIMLPEFSVFTSQTEVGCIVTAEIKPDVFLETVLLEMEIQLDDPENFSMTYSNRLRLDNGGFSYSDLMGQVVKTGSAVSFDSLKWSNWENDYKDSVTTFISSSLNAAVNNLVSSDNQDILINQNGLRARQWNEGTSSYEDKQMWMVNNMLAFSDDGFQTAKLALGEIILQGGGTAFGVVGEVIVGKILAGNTLTIANSANNFVLDETGATLNNANFSVQTTNTKIIIDPTATNSFSIQKNEGGTFNNKFWVDNSGNVNFSGNLSGATGTFSGTLSATVGNIGTLIIDANGLKTADGTNYLRGNGDLKWGGLSISGSSAVFTGDIYANKIVGQIVNTQVADGAISDNKILSGLSAGKITAGTMSGSRIYGGTIGFPGVTMGTTSNGASEIRATGSISLLAGSNGVSVTSSYTILGSSSSTSIVGGSLQVNGSIYVPGGTGYTASRTVSTPAGTKVITFSRGIVVSFT